MASDPDKAVELTDEQLEQIAGGDGSVDPRDSIIVIKPPVGGLPAEEYPD